MIEATSDVQAIQEGERRLKDAEENARDAIAEAFRKYPVGGVIFCDQLVYLTRDPVMIGYHWTQLRVANPRAPAMTHAVLVLLDRCLMEKPLTPERIAALVDWAEEKDAMATS